MSAGNRMQALVACMFVACLTQGQLYAFSVYGGALKASLELSQSDLDSIATFPYISGLFVWLPGRLNDRWGPRAAIRFGATGMALGTVAYWALAKQLLVAPRVPALVAVMFLTQLVHGAVTAGIFSSLVRNFPLERGVAAGIGKAWIGLSSGILTQLYTSFVGTPSNSPETLDFLLLLAAACLVAAIGPASRVVLYPQRRRERGLRMRFGVLSFAVWATAALVTTSALLGTELSAYRRLFGVAIVIAILTPVVVTFDCTGQNGRSNRRAESSRTRVAVGSSEHYEVLPGDESSDGDGITEDEEDSEVESVYSHQRQSLGSVHRGNNHDATVGVGCNGPATNASRLPELSTTEVVRTMECWLLGLGAVCLWGGGQMVSVNVNQMCESFGYGEPAAAVSLFAVGNGLGRLVAGPLSDLTHRQQICPRPLWLCIATCIMAAANATLMLSELGTTGLYIGVFCVGCSFGSMFTLNVVISSELWGLRHHGANYMLFDGVTSVFGTLGMAKFVTQTVYSSHIDGDARVCYGRDCFATTHLVIVGSCCLGLVGQALVAWRTRALYRDIWDQQRAAAP